MLVMKFGGTSLGDRERLLTVVELIRSRLDREPVVVCSAHGGVTDLLIEGAEAAARGEPDLAPIRQRQHDLLESLDLRPSLVDEELRLLHQMFQGLSLLPAGLSPAVMDQIAGMGERMSVRAVAALLQRSRIPAVALQADEIGMVTTGRHGRATPLPEAFDQLRTSLEAIDVVPVVTGFIGRSREGATTTLGRSGSDFTATILARAIDAEEVEIWTDVSGVLTADPRLVPEARPVGALTYAEASELAYYGAKVIHPATIQPAVEGAIPVRILNTMHPEDPGTVIGPSNPHGGTHVTSIASKSGITLINITSGRMLGQSGFMARVFDVFKAHDVVVDLIATSEVSVTVSVDEEEGLDEVLALLRGISTVTVAHDNALIAVVGERMIQASGLAGTVFGALGDAGVPIRAISYGATKTNLQLVVPRDRCGEAVRTLHDALFPKD